MSITRFVTGAALVAALAAPLAASAQSAAPPAGSPPPSAGPGAMHHHQQWRHHRHNPYLHALRSLDLNDAQKEKVRAAFRQMREADRVAMRANAEKLRAQVEGILTPAQRSQLRTTLEHERAQDQPPAP